MINSYHPFTPNFFSNLITKLGVEVKAKNPGDFFEI